MKKEKRPYLPGLAAAAVIVDVILYVLFFLFHKEITTVTSAITADKYNWWVRDGLQQVDGYETYVMYLMVFINLILVYFLADAITGLKETWKKAAFFLAAFLMAALLVWKAGVTLPMATNSMMDLLRPKPHTYPLLVKILLITGVFYFLDRKIPLLAGILAAVFLVPVCLFKTMPYSMSDYRYVLTPALRILHGFPLSATFFQYDALMSLIAAAMLKLKISYDYLSLLARFSYYLLFLGLYFYAKKAFIDKRLPALFLVTLVIYKIYCIFVDPALVIQVTPLRIDLWFPLLVIAYIWGPYSIYLGLATGFLTVFANTFGIIYSLSYLALLGTFYCLELAGLPKKQAAGFRAARELFIIHMKKAWPNLLALALSFVIYWLAFKMTAPASSTSIVGAFTPVSPRSFYWYFPVAFSVAFCLLAAARKRTGEKYFANGMFLIFLAAGNCVYFFGRSHENNLINMGAVLVALSFLAMDILMFTLRRTDKNTGAAWPAAALITVPALMIAVMTVCYSDRIDQDLRIQDIQRVNGQYMDRFDAAPMMGYLKRMKEVTGNSPKVCVLSESFEFIYDYYGNYTPLGYFTPIQNWKLRKDLEDFVQKQLDDGYYVVTDGAVLDEIYPKLHSYAQKTDSGLIFLAGGLLAKEAGAGWTPK